MPKARGKVRQADQLETRRVDELTPYARNARTHSEAQVDQLAASIERFGFTNPVLIDPSGEIVAGHGRVLAAKKLGLQDVPVLVVGWLSPEERRAYVIADNRLALNSEWDFDVLSAEIREIQTEGLELDLLGFSSSELDELLGLAGGSGSEDDAPEPGEDPITQPGDVWILGDHRLRCGDATNPEDVDALLAGVRPHLMVTDPPYGVEYDPKWRAKIGVNLNPSKLGVVLNDERADWRDAWALFPGSVAYVWHAGLYASIVAESLTATGFDIRSQIIWVKDRFALSRGHYHWRHEPCWYAVRKGATARWTGGRKQSTVWEIPARDDAGFGHGTQKPVEAMRRPILHNSKRGDAVYDPFCGSGTTIIAAETTGRACFAMELAPTYCDVIVRRWEQITGKTAVREADGATLESLAA